MKILLILILLFAITIASAFVFEPDIYLEGFPQLDGNSIDFYHFDKGLSLSPTHRVALNNQSLKNEIDLNYDSNLVKITFKSSDLIVTLPVYISIQKYYSNIYKFVFKKKLKEKMQKLLEDTERAEGRGLFSEIEIGLPDIPLPKSVRRFMGNKAGRLNLDGSQKLDISVSNTTRANDMQAENDKKNDIDVVLKQDLDIRLHGTIGEKIHVDVNHRSTSDDNVMATPTEINVSYEGDEDEILKSLEGGNIALSLSGSEFIRYSVSSEGLFGIKAKTEVGNLKITTILGKDEAKKDTKKYSGSSQADSTVIESRNFVSRTHYFIADPNYMYNFESGPQGWADNAIELTDRGEWLLTDYGANVLPKPNEDITVYLDDHNANNNTNNTIEGVSTDETNTTIYNFEILTDGSDYFVDYESGIVIMNQTIDKRYTIGITYTQMNDTIVGCDSISNLEVKLLRESNQDYGGQYWDLQIRNIYSLGMQNIKNEGFDLRVFQENEDQTQNYYLPSDISTGDYVTYNDYLRLDTNADGKINGEDTTVNLQSGYIIFPFLRPFESLNDSILYQDENIQYDEFENYISVKGQVGRGQISLGQMNILPNSVVIKIGLDQTKLQENIDYIVDYDFGNITFLTSRAKDPGVEIDISYQFVPLFSIDSRVIMGMRADMELSPNFDLGGTIIYQSEKVKEDHPKIGSENRSIILADIDGKIDYEVPFITKAIDFLPLIKTDAKSSVSLSSEIAMSIPNVYGSDKQHNKDEAYIDDMESILDAFPLGVTRSVWSPASEPHFALGEESNFSKANINYYMPQNIYRRDVYDPSSLTEEEEREKVSVLACKIKPMLSEYPRDSMKYWAGIMKYVGNQMDFSNKKYLEFLVKVDTLNSNPTPVTMHINLGDINENFYTFTDSLEYEILDIEDGLVYRDGILDYGEDVGLDRVANGNEGDDPNDDWSNEKVIVNGDEEYPYINRTENNNRLDSEDLDDNGMLNTKDVYFEYSVQLNSGSEYSQNIYKGWELFRVPIHGNENFKIVTDQNNLSPDIEEICYARVWFEVEDTTRIKIASMDIVGNKWEEDKIRDDNEEICNNENEIMSVGIIDNQKSQHYISAPYTVIEESGEETVEQSLTINYENLGAEHHGLVTQKFRESFNFLGYNKIRFWVYSELPDSSLSGISDKPDSLIMRLGSDSLNYYEIKHKLDTQYYFQDGMDIDGWREIEVDFTDLTMLKMAGEEDSTIINSNDNFTFKKVGKPTLTNIEEISLGMRASEEFSGTIYFDDIRVAEPYEEIGFATRVSFHASFADFSALDITYNWKTQNFQSSATRNQNSNYNEDTNFNLINKYYLNKLFPAEWGLNLPLTLTRNQSWSIPRFKANSDILLKDLSKEDREKERIKNLTHRATFNYSQNKTPRSKILALITKNTSISSSIEKRKSTSATTADTTFAFSVTHDYDLNISLDKVDLNLWKDYKFYFFPKLFTNQIKYQESRPKKWRWDTSNDTLHQWIPQLNSDTTRTINSDTEIKYDVFSDFVSTYKISTKRDLMLKNYWKDFNIGKEKERQQKITLSYSPKYVERIFSFNTDASVDYDEDHIKSSVEDTLYFKGGVNRNISGKITLKNRDLLMSFADWIENIFPKKISSEKGDEEKSSEEKKEIKNSDEKEKAETKEEEKKENKNEKDEASSQNPADNSNFISAFINYFARINNITINYNNGYKTSYEDRLKRPEFLYQLGLPHILDETGDDKEINSKNISDKYSTSITFPIIDRLTTSWSYSKEFKRAYGNNSKLDITTIFPNISVTLSEFEKLIHLEDILSNSRLSSSFVVTTTESGDIDFTDPETKMVKINFSPLISWNGNWPYEISSNFSINYSNSKNERIMSSYNTTTTATTTSATGRLSWAYSNPGGLKLLFYKTDMKNELTTNINFSFENTLNETKGQDGSVTDVEKIKYSIKPGASYKFNRSINAGLTSNYEWNLDKKRDKEITTFSLGIWIEILF